MEPTKRQFQIIPFKYKAKCEMDACRGWATVAVGREGSHSRRQLQLCDDCLWHMGLSVIDRFNDDKKFRAEASAAFGNTDIAKGSPVSSLMDENKQLVAEKALMQEELNLLKQANAEFEEWREEKNKANRENARQQRERAKAEKEASNGKK